MSEERSRKMTKLETAIAAVALAGCIQGHFHSRAAVPESLVAHVRVARTEAVRAKALVKCQTQQAAQTLARLGSRM